jgi:hypothetical protein
MMHGSFRQTGPIQDALGLIHLLRGTVGHEQELICLEGALILEDAVVGDPQARQSSSQGA